ncbi:MAG: ribosome silencing factor, partial [Planctomycetota bacterium]
MISESPAPGSADRPPQASVDPSASASTSSRPEPRRDASTSDDARDRALAIEIARLLADDKSEDVAILDIRGLSPVTNFVVLGTGQSDRQIRAAAEHVSQLARERDFARFGSDQDDARTWVVLDFVEVMVHLFEPATRAHYDL